MLKNYIYSTLNKTNKRLITQLSINCLVVSIDEGEFQNCTFLIKEIKKLLNNELNYYEQTVFLYTCGYFEFRNKDQKGIEKMKQALQILEILGEHNIKLQYQEHYDKYVQ